MAPYDLELAFGGGWLDTKSLLKNVAQASLPVRPAGFKPANTSLEGRWPHSLEGRATGFTTGC